MPRPRITSGQRLLRNILSDNGFGPVEMEHPIAGYSVDLYLTRSHVGIEYEGPIHHLRHQRDLIRQAEIVKCGLPILRITSDELRRAKTNPTRLISKVKAFIRERGKTE